ncbi:transporter substrate-binding domain-containing protein [Oleiharenicola lentus]|uniref:histidine kinase n=1 Tax=Oleiharenicola lentus TaxID=2508720 RepID=A0A4Q1C4M7_9BACT|nr:transporter substrate-binding domain-containing protein [Oleiharenicola lentus]RXK53352.1 transporter substrate-binding domain-containing protein [Oleiharenicola lentus]
MIYPKQPYYRVLFACLLLAGAGAMGGAEPPGESRVLRVGVLTDNYPYSFRDSDGKVKGFAYDVVDGVVEVMGLKVERIEGNTQQIYARFERGELDILQSLAQMPEREAVADFSVPYLNMVGTIFVHKDDQRVLRVEDLRGRRVGVHRSSLGEMLLRQSGLGDSIVYVESVQAALEQVNNGQIDATLASRLTGLSLARREGWKNIKALQIEVPGYDVRYCVAVREGDHRLLAQVNEGLAILVRTGRFDEYYRKWFSHVEPSRYTLEQVLMAVAVGLALALLVVLWAAARQRRLRRQIARQAAELRAGEERYRSLFEGTPDGLLVLETAATSGAVVVVQANPSARRLLQTGSGPAPGARLHHVLSADATLADRLTAASRQGEATEFEHEKPGAAGWWRVSVSPLGSRFLVSLRDISEQTQARLRLQRQEERMRHSQKIEAIGTLAGGIAHDFNNLLTAIIGNTQLSLMNLPPDHPEVASLEQVLKAGRRAQQLVKQILTFSRRSEASRQAVKISPLIEEVMGFLRAVARGTVEFAHRTGPVDTEILADPAQVHQVLMNIGTNALQAMRGTQGRLLFTEEEVVLEAGTPLQPDLKPGRYLRIGVADTGPGMSREVVDRIFEPFFTTKPMGEGTGLGLSVVHGIMQQHDGAVTVTSELGRGTLFQLYFPLATARPAPAATETRPAAVQLGQGQSILLVDDDASIVETVRKVLQRLGYTVSAHLRAEDALAEFEAAPDRFALVLSDLTMPGVNGLQLAARVRARRPRSPLVLVSGYWPESDLAEARRLQVSATLHKPLSYESIGRIVADHVARA